MISHRCFRSYVDLLSILQDYHNLRAAAFNSQARELTQKTADLAALVQERDRLVKS